MRQPTTDLIERVARTVRQHRLFMPGDTLVVALSGGADSTALLDILLRLPDFNLTLVVAHLNHMLRGAESDADEEFCRELAAEKKLLFYSRRVDVAGLAATTGSGLEDAGRRARIDFLDDVRVNSCASAVLLAHHADDQAETVLMRLLRGAGPTGLQGMGWRNSRNFIRPLLEVSRADLLKYLQSIDQDWREDASNYDQSLLRNRIRHQVIPLLQEINPAATDSLCNTASLLADDNDFLDTTCRKIFNREVDFSSGRATFVAAELAAHHPAVQGRLIRLALTAVTGDLAGFSRRHISDLIDLTSDGPPNRSLSLPRSLTARRQYGQIIIERTPAHREPVSCHISGPGTFQLWNGLQLQVSLAATPESCAPPTLTTAYINLATAPFPWLARTFQPGDRIRPFGMAGSKKVKDLFIDAKVPLPNRRTIPLVFCGETLLWAAGLRRSAEGTCDKAATHIARVDLIETPGSE